MLSRANIPKNPSASAVFLSSERKADYFGEPSKSCGSFYLSDHLGSTRAVVDDAGNVLETFDYYPFGLLMPKRSSTTGNTLEKFTGKERDTEGNLNLDYFGARYYDPALGRWHSVDPLADDYPAWSPYNYTLNNPLNLIDPDGQMVDCPRCPIYQSLEAAFGPITSFISNLIMPDQATASVSVEVKQGNESMEFGVENASITQFDANGLPTGVENTTESIVEGGVSIGPVETSTDKKTTTTRIDGGKVSGELQMSESGFEKAGINAGSKNLRPGISIDKNGRTGFNVEGEAEGKFGSFFIKVKGKIESFFNPGRAFENAAKTSTGIEKRLRQQ